MVQLGWGMGEVKKGSEWHHIDYKSWCKDMGELCALHMGLQDRVRELGLP